jgi:hypothetical protein
VVLALKRASRQSMMHSTEFVMPGFMPGIHVSEASSKTWMAGTSPVMTTVVIQFQFI